MRYTDLIQQLRADPKRWCVTGAAGFIGSHLVEELLRLNQIVVGLDNFSTGYRHNLDDVVNRAGKNSARFSFIEGDIRNLDSCRSAVEGADFVLHQAALGSVPRSIEDPLSSHQSNVDGFVHILTASRDEKVKRVVYASSSSVYGDVIDSPKVESRTGQLMSPYAVTKQINELYAYTFSLVYGLGITGLRYFNVFGPRQDPNGSYAAVIPKWIGSLLAEQTVTINGDGETTRDFCHVSNVVQANILAACANVQAPTHSIYNVAVGETTSLNELFAAIRYSLDRLGFNTARLDPVYGPFRAGDIRHSLADITAIIRDLGYAPQVRVSDGIPMTVEWYVSRMAKDNLRASKSHI